MPQLDSLRAFAIGAVMFWHFHPGRLGDHFIPLRLGVELFFVLSGFLITGIRLRGSPTTAFIGSFYLRRMLHLFPLYYVVLAILLIASPAVRHAWVSFAFYGVNFWVFRTRIFGCSAHFWSLAVEEQFYFVWALIVLFTPRRVFSYVCGSLILLAGIFRFVTIATTHNALAYVLLPGSVDSLACGALLAYFGPPVLRVRHAHAAVMAPIGIEWCTTLWTCIPRRSLLFSHRCISCCSILWLQVPPEASKDRSDGYFPAQNCAMLALSNGIYVIHVFIPGLLALTFPVWQPTERSSPLYVWVCLLGLLRSHGISLSRLSIAIVKS